jgi:predicted acyl esterase
LTEQRLVQANRGKHLVYQTTPYPADTEVSGFFRLSAWIAIDQPDTDFQAAIFEVAPDGSSVELGRELVRARYRETARTPKLIDTKEPLRYDFKQLPFVSRQIKKGNFLRLVIGPNNSIYNEKNYNSGGVVGSETVKDARPVNVVLHHSQEYPSILYVPLGQPE